MRAALLLLPLLAASLLAGPASAQPAPGTPAKAAPSPPGAPAKAAPAPVAPPRDYAQKLAFPAGVTMTRTVYRQVTGFRPLALDLYLPSARGFPRPALLFVHGGGWSGGDSRHAGTFADFPGLLALLAARGYVVASLDYRLSGEAKFPAALTDVKSAIAWLRAHAETFNLDVTRVAVWGASAGGQLAAMAGLTCGVAAFEPPPDPASQNPPSTCVQAVIDWYGVSDFDSVSTDIAQPLPADEADRAAYLGCGATACAPGTTRAASPVTYVKSTSPPFLIQHGEADGVISPKQSQKLQDALRAAGVPAELATYPGVGHDFARPDGAADGNVNRLAIQKLEAFLDATFPRKPMTAPYKPKPAKDRALPY